MMNNIEQVIIDVIAKCISVETIEINADTHLKDDLGIDSSEMVEINHALEELLKIPIAVEDFKDLSTVRECAQYLKAHSQAVCEQQAV